MQCHAQGKDMCLHNVLHTTAKRPTQRDGTVYCSFSRAICSQSCENTPHIHPLCMCPFRCQGLPHLGHLHICKVLHHVLLKAGRVAKTTKEETVYHRGCAVKVSTAMKDTMEAEHLALEPHVCCEPPDALPSDTRLHRLLVAPLGVKV